MNTADIIQKAVKWAYDTAVNSDHGYSQVNRWGPDYDCSSFVISAYDSAGLSLRKNGATYTGNMREVMLKNGFTDVTKLVNFSRGSGFLYGDVLLNTRSHTAIYAGNNQTIEASIDENGGVKGEKSGDQTEKEILVRYYRNYPWNYCLRFTGIATKRVTKKLINEIIAGKWGNGVTRERLLTEAGYNYNDVQSKVNKVLRGV